VSHQVIIINSVTPPAPAAAAATTSESEPEFKVTVEYRPPHGLTASQIGNEVARIQRRVNQIIEGTAD
jgi:hypothetical protein